MSGKKPAAYFTLDAKKLGRDGFLMMGEVNALNRWMIAFDNMRQKSQDLTERTFLGEVVAALTEDAERIQMELAVYAQARGAGKEVPVEPPTQNAPSTEAKQ